MKVADDEPVVEPLPRSDIARETRLVALAQERAEERLLNGTASAQEITVLLKMGFENTKLQNQKLEQDILLAQAKTKAIEQQARDEEMFKAAIKAMGIYSGEENAEDQDDYGDDYDDY